MALEVEGVVDGGMNGLSMLQERQLHVRNEHDTVRVIQIPYCARVGRLFPLLASRGVEAVKGRPAFPASDQLIRRRCVGYRSYEPASCPSGPKTCCSQA